MQCFSGGGGGKGDAQTLCQVFGKDLDALRASLSLLRCARFIRHVTPHDATRFIWITLLHRSYMPLTAGAQMLTLRS